MLWSALCTEFPEDIWLIFTHFAVQPEKFMSIHIRLLAYLPFTGGKTKETLRVYTQKL